jgi:predicted HTH transcriptional regulator
MPAKIIESLFAKRTRNSIGRIKSNQQKLKFEQLKIYYDSASKRLNNQFASNLQLLTGEGKFNFVAFLVADVNSLSIKVAKYRGSNRVHLVENNEYGYCSLIKGSKQVLDKIELENKTLTKITSKERKEKRLWDAIALREAIINAFVHNDYTDEVPPKFELFSDRIEITSAGGLPEGLSQQEFFEGYSVPRNQEIMRIFKDLDLVEHLGSGVPRILETYGRECFKFSDNFLRMIFPAAGQVTEQVTEQVTDQVKNLLQVMTYEPMGTTSLMSALDLKHRPTFRINYINTAIALKLIEMTIPDKPNSRLQKYQLTKKGINVKENK